MEISEHIDQLHAEGTRLAAVAGRADLDAGVGYLPDWTVRDVVTHVGGIHRWAAQIIGEAGQNPDNAAGQSVGTGPADDELVEWFAAGHGALVETLRAAPSELECFAFLPAPSPLAFWARRQALETAVHRADVELATGQMTPFDHALALDGIDEILIGFGARPRRFEPGVLRLEPEGGPPWEVTLGPGVLSARPAADGGPDATVAGTASDVYLWLWNRPATVEITGDAAVADQWKQFRVRWS